MENEKKRKVILYIALSLDGYIADENGGVTWLAGDGSQPDTMGTYNVFYKTIDTVVMGWNTYYQIVSELAPGNWPYKACNSYIFTHKQVEDQENIHFIKDDLIEFIQGLRDELGKNVWICGGANIARQLMQAQLIDEYCFSIIPSILGKGVKLFAEKDLEMKLKLKRTEIYNGIIDLVYEVR